MPRYFRIEALPEELKVRILELLDEADQSYKAWSDSIYKREDAKSELEDLIQSKRNLYGKGIRWMSLVSRAWRKRCAPWLFKTLNFDSLLAPEYVFDIGPQYSELFTHLVVAFEGPPDFTTDEIIQSMALLNNRTPRLRSMLVEGDAIASFFGCETLPPNGWISILQPGYRRNAMRAWEVMVGKLEKLQELSIEYIKNPNHVQELVQNCSNLTTLSLEFNLWEEVECTTVIAGSMEQFKNLRNLSIVATSYRYDTSKLDLLVATLETSSSRPPLVSLSLTALGLHSSWLTLASLFSDTLSSLAFASFDTDSGSFNTFTPPFLFTGSSFPQLRNLSVSAIRTVSEPILLSANSTSFPRLNSISFGLNFFCHFAAHSMSSANTLFAHARGLAPTAREISIYDNYWSMPSSTSRIAQRWKSKNSRPGVPTMSEAFIEDFEGEEPESTKAYAASISQTVDYLVGLKNRAVTFTNWTELESLLQGVEMHRVLMQS
ncbi:hypothetical protein JCM5350_007482 [Sporobolomyces pararoseus]